MGSHIKSYSRRPSISKDDRTKRLRKTMGIPSCVLAMVTSVFLIMACSPGYSVDDLVGVWTGEDADRDLRIEFRQDHTFDFRVVEVSGLEHVIDGRFEGDFSKSPIPLTLRNIPQLDHPLHTIITFQDDNLVMGRFSARWRERPISFAATDTLVFEKTSSEN